MAKTIIIGMAQLDALRSEGMLESLALGSCVGIVLYDPVNKIGGLAHAMLPTIEKARENSRLSYAKFVDTTIVELIKKMERLGAERRFIKARLAGGANMFPDVRRADGNHIGMQNVSSARRKLEEMGVPITAEDTGGTFGRTICLDVATGRLRVRSIASGEKEI